MTSKIGVKKIQYPNGTDILTLDSSGSLAIAAAATVGGTLGVTGIGTFTDDIVIGDGKTIGSASKTDAITIASSGLTQLRSTGIGAGSQVFQVIDDGATLFQLRAEDGNISFPQAGAGIYLGVTSGTSSNLLDDFEEGTYTHGLSNFSTAISSGWTTGRYVKIGHTVYFHGVIVANSGNVGGTVAITGLPFTVIAGSQGYSVGMINGSLGSTVFGSGNHNPVQRIDPNQTYLNTGVTSGSGGVNLVYSGFYTSA